VEWNKSIIFEYRKKLKLEIMTTATYLKNNRKEIVSILTNIVNSLSGVTLKQAMIVFKSEMKATDNNTTLSYFAVKQIEQTFGEIEVVYTKSYSESNHAKQVNYYGKDKTNQLNNI
jgi:hypothetical protein